LWIAPREKRRTRGRRRGLRRVAWARGYWAVSVPWPDGRGQLRKAFSSAASPRQALERRAREVAIPRFRYLASRTVGRRSGADMLASGMQRTERAGDFNCRLGKSDGECRNGRRKREKERRREGEDEGRPACLVGRGNTVCRGLDSSVRARGSELSFPSHHPSPRPRRALRPADTRNRPCLSRERCQLSHCIVSWHTRFRCLSEESKSRT
jgi:hypothetical protein